MKRRYGAERWRFSSYCMGLVCLLLALLLVGAACAKSEDEDDDESDNEEGNGNDLAKLMKGKSSAAKKKEKRSWSNGRRCLELALFDGLNECLAMEYVHVPVLHDNLLGEFQRASLASLKTSRLVPTELLTNIWTSDESSNSQKNHVFDSGTLFCFMPCYRS